MKIKDYNVVSSKSGIYKITNTKSNNFYIGSSVNLNKRFSLHKLHLKNNLHHNVMLQRVYNNYDKNSLLFEIIEFCEKDKILEREQFYINTLKPKYNICKIAGNCTGVKHTQETKDLMSSQRKGKKKPKEYSEKLSKRLKGISKSKEHVEKFRKSLTGRKLSKEHIENIRNKAIGRKYIKTQKMIDNLNNLKNLEKRIKNLPRGSQHKLSVFTEEQVLEIRNLNNLGVSNSDIYKKYPNVNKKSIRNVINKLTYKHI